MLWALILILPAKWYSITSRCAYRSFDRGIAVELHDHSSFPLSSSYAQNNDASINYVIKYAVDNLVPKICAPCPSVAIHMNDVPGTSTKVLGMSTKSVLTRLQIDFAPKI